MCRFLISLEDWLQARLFAENESRACITYGYDDAMLRNLGTFCVHRVKLDVPFDIRSLEIVERWCIKRSSVLEYSCVCGGGNTCRPGYGKLPVCCH